MLRIARIFRTGALLLWASPVTLVGLLLAAPALAVRGRFRLISGATRAVLVQGAFTDWALPRHPAGKMRAMALGHLVVAVSGPLPARLLAHELEHVRQAERWGPLFPLLYLGSSTWQWLRGRDPYWHNRFEVAARAAEKSSAAKTG